MLYLCSPILKDLVKKILMNTSSINKSFLIILFAFLTTASISAQEIVLYGNVFSTSADGSFFPVAGAYVGLADSGNSDHYDLTDDDGHYEFSFLWNWDGPIVVICEAEGYDTQTATVMPAGEVEVELNFVLSPSQQEQNGVLFGNVTYQFSPTGPVMPVAGASIGATPSWGPEPWFQTETNEDGHYELELWANDAPWIVYCTTEYGQQEAEVVITAGQETELNFHFNAWEEQPAAPYDLVAEYSPYGGENGMAILNWEYNSLDPTESLFHIYLYYGSANVEWMLVGESPETHFEYIFEDDFPPSDESCFKITAISNGEESEPSNTACVSLDSGWPWAPYDLTATYVDTAWGGAYLEWSYTDPTGIPTNPDFQVYLRSETWSGGEWIFIDETNQMNYLFFYGDYVPPANETCFYVTAVRFEQESDPSNTTCIIMDELENGVVYGTVYEMSLDPNEVILIAGAVIHFFIGDIGDTWTVISGDNGGYEISLLPGTYQVWVEAGGYFPNDDESVTVIPNEEVEQNFYLQPYDNNEFVLRGFVRGQSENDPSGWQPLPGSQIRATPNDQEEPVYEAVTNEEGFYELPLPSGYYDVTAEHEGYEPGFAYVYIGPDNENWHDFYLEQTDSQNAGIHGLVYWETPNWGEIMISGAQIRAESSNANLVYEAETGDGGGYEMEVMGDHHYVVTCTAEFEGMELVQVHEIYVGESWVELNFSFGGGPPEVALHGHVFGIEQDMVYPLPGAYVYATPTGPTDPVWETYADSTGFYFLELPIGEYSVTAMYEGFETVTEEVFVGPNGENIQDFYLQLQGTSGNGEIAGNVWMITSENDQTPIPGALLWAHSEDGLVFEAITNENGHYEMEVSGNHHYNVSCYAFVGSDTLWAEEDIYVDEDVVVELNFSFGGVPSEFGWLAGYVHDSNPEPFPIPGATVMAYNVMGEFITETNEGGYFEMELPPAMGYSGYQVVVHAEGFQDYYHPEPVYIYPNEETVLEIMMEPASTEVGYVYGMVIDGVQNYPIPGAVVWAASDAHEFETHTGSQGEFDFELPPGAYELGADAEGYNPSLGIMIEIEVGDIVTVNITLFPNSQMEISIDYMSGWNLTGHPLEGAEPGDGCFALTNLFHYTMSGYEETEQPFVGEGYWIRFSDECTVTFTGDPIDWVTLDLMSNWNMISGISWPVWVHNIIDYGEILVPNTIFGFDESGYTNAEYIEPGRGYWIRTYEEGQIEISTGIEDNASAKAVVFTDHLSGANTIRFNGKVLHFGVDVPEEHRLSYSLPPKPFSSAFDVRFSGGWTFAEDYGEIELQGITGIVTVQYDISIPAGENLYWNLIDDFGHEHILDGSGSITISGGEQIFTLKKSRVIPEEISLRQNYPNPFNPVTTIGFSLPEEINVTLRVYDLTGRMVSELLNGKLVSGVHEVRWDASGFSNGVYFVRMESGNKFVQTQKMILLK